MLLHDLGYDRTMWWPVAAELGDDLTAVAVDLPGHGRSAVRDRAGLDLLTHDLAMLVYRLDAARPPILVGHGRSAALAEALADRLATHAVITVGSEGPDPLCGVPEAYRQFARPDPACLAPYRGWHPTPACRPAAPAGPDRVVTARTLHLGDEHFPHLRDPAGFAALLHGVR